MPDFWPDMGERDYTVQRAAMVGTGQPTLTNTPVACLVLAGNEGRHAQSSSRVGRSVVRSRSSGSPSPAGNASPEIVPNDPGLGWIGPESDRISRPNDTFDGLYGRSLRSVFAGGASYATCVIDVVGKLVRLGEDYLEPWGDPTNLDNSRAVMVPTDGALSGVPLEMAATGLRHSCALDDAGLAFCWGLGDRGQLGTGDYDTRLAPRRVDRSGVLHRTRLVDIDAGPRTTCAVDGLGTAYCWGRGGQGQLGNASSAGSAVPVRVRRSGSELRFTHIEVGQSHTCALTRTHQVYCWGNGRSGRLGTGDQRDSQRPTRVHGLKGVTVRELSVGFRHTCIRDDTRETRCWGRNDYGALGTGDRENRLTPTPISGSRKWHSIQANRLGTCGLDVNDSLFCWGRAAGFRAPADRHAYQVPHRAWTGPSALHGRTIVQLTEDAPHGCALTASGRGYCWGGGRASGFGGKADIPDPLPVDITGVLKGVHLTEITAAVEHTCAIDDAGRAYCWGTHFHGRLGNGGGGSNGLPVAVDRSGVLAGKQLVDISAGVEHTCAVDDRGKAYCWGGGHVGQLGRGSREDTRVPVRVATSGALSDAHLVAIEAGWLHTCALDNEGRAYCWGDNASGEVGDGTTHRRLRPRAVDTTGVLADTDLTQLTASSDFTCALDKNGAAYCWGAGGSGQMGNNTSEEVNSSPHAVDMSALGSVTFESLSAGNQWVSALGSDGRVYSWGARNPATPQELTSGTAFDATHVTALGTDNYFGLWVVTKPR